MVFSLKKGTKIYLATIQTGNIIEQYECSQSTCDNPVCTCGVVSLSLTPLEHKDRNNQISPHIVRIDIINRKLDDNDEDNIPKGSLNFARLLISKLDEADFRLLWDNYCAYKSKITAKASNDSIEAHFDYREIEEKGLMATYNDVLPYADQLLVTVNGENYKIFDQYCVLPKCPCSETGLAICPAGEFDKTGEEQYSVRLDYRKQKWGTLEGRTKTVDTKTIRSAVEQQIPDIYEKLLNRHMKLRDIYSHCKKKHFEHTQRLHPPEAGRNDPCPCGSGKKYKKCCLKN
jgi:hypothetical protein